MLPFPRTSIRRNGLTLHLYLPDPEEGFYRATRFDWSPQGSSLMRLCVSDDWGPISGALQVFIHAPLYPCA